MVFHPLSYIKSTDCVIFYYASQGNVILLFNISLDSKICQLIVVILTAY